VLIVVALPELMTEGWPSELLDAADVGKGAHGLVPADGLCQRCVRLRRCFALYDAVEVVWHHHHGMTDLVRIAFFELMIQFSNHFSGIGWNKLFVDDLSKKLPTVMDDKRNEIKRIRALVMTF
jgi:hypothetical protein